MKEAFLKAMAEVWPGGLDWQNDKRQHRDMIRLFTMGWMEALESLGKEEECRLLYEEYKYLSDYNCWPDETWRWV